MKSLTLRNVHERAGARFREEDGLELVERYGAVADEVRALKSAAGVMDRSDLGKTRVEGRDRVRYLNSMVTNEVAKLAAGQGTYAMLLTNQGKLVSDLWLYVFPEHMWMIQEPRVQAAGLAMLDRFLIADKVKFKDATDALGWLSVQGPEAETVVKRALGLETLPDEAHGHRPFVLEGAAGPVEGEVIRENRSGPGGFDLVAPVEGLETVWAALVAAGAKPVGRQAWDIVRIECGVPVAGRDMGETTIPLEAGPGVEARAIDHHKGCYIGQEVICRVKQRGHVNWMLTAMKVDAGVTAGSRLFSPEKDVGWVTSVIESPDQGWIGLGYVHRNARKLGEKLAVGASDGAMHVELHEVPPGP